jgi:hypothetical protein
MDAIAPSGRLSGPRTPTAKTMMGHAVHTETDDTRWHTVPSRSKQAAEAGAKAIQPPSRTGLPTKNPW